jgi:hypothetical protein
MMRIESHATGDYKADSAAVSTGDAMRFGRKQHVKKGLGLKQAAEKG